MSAVDLSASKVSNSALSENSDLLCHLLCLEQLIRMLSMSDARMAPPAYFASFSEKTVSVKARKEQLSSWIVQFAWSDSLRKDMAPKHKTLHPVDVAVVGLTSVCGCVVPKCGSINLDRDGVRRNVV